jgi:integrase
VAYIQKLDRKHKDGTPAPVRWKARYRDADGRERSKMFPRRKDAEKFLERNGTDIQTGEWIDPHHRRSLFSGWADEWWATTAKLRPATRRGYWQVLKNHVGPEFKDRPLGTIDYMDIERFIAAKLNAGYGRKYVREMVNVLSLIMQCAVKANARRDNPAAGHKLHVPIKRAHQADMLTMDQAIKLVEHASTHYHQAMWLLLYTGMRPSELCGLKVGDLDLTHNLLHVGPTYTPVASYDGRPRQLVDGPPKTDAGHRPIPLPTWLCTALSTDLARRPHRPQPTDYLILNKQGQPVNRDTFRARIVRPALKKAGLPDVFRTYDVRHTHASLLIHDGADLLTLSKRMGHTDPAITLRVYGHLFEGAQQDLTDRLDRRRLGAISTPENPAIAPVQDDTAGRSGAAAGPQGEGSDWAEMDTCGPQPRMPGSTPITEKPSTRDDGLCALPRSEKARRPAPSETA